LSNVNSEQLHITHGSSLQTFCLFNVIVNVNILLRCRWHTWQLSWSGVFWEGVVENGSTANASQLPVSGRLCRPWTIWHWGYILQSANNS